jgi:CBS domain-containing protein
MEWNYLEVIKDYRRIFPPALDRFYERSKQNRLVSDIMSTEVITTEPDLDMGAAARIMGEERVGSLIVVERERPVGIVTERDLLSRVVAKGLAMERVSVRSCMSSPLITIDPSASIKEAAQTMMKKKGRLAVFDREDLVGIITASDLIKSMPWVEETRLMVDEFMTRKVETFDDGVKVSVVARVMGEKRIGSVVVKRQEAPVGIFTERDLLTTLLAKAVALDIPVGEVCSSPLYVIPSGTPVNVTAHVMSSRHIKRLPIVDEDETMIGIITARDLVEAYAK